MSLSKFSGIRNAIDFAYGIPGSGASALAVYTGNTATGAGNTITVTAGQFVTADGVTVLPFSTTAPITIGTGAQAETVTPTAVSNVTPGQAGTCVITANFTKIHYAGEPITSATVGMAEAVNHVHSKGGGLVAFDAAWVAAGGATSQFAGKTYSFTDTTLLDWRGTPNAKTAGMGKSWTVANNGDAYTASTIALY